MTPEQNEWNETYTKGTLRHTPTDMDKMVPDDIEPESTDCIWYGVGAIMSVVMMVLLVVWMLETLLG